MSARGLCHASVLIMLAAVTVLGVSAARASEAGLDEPWVGIDGDGAEVVELYFVFTSTCPHCRAAIPFVQELAAERPWVRVWWLQADAGDPRVVTIAREVAEAAGGTISGVPTFIFCGEVMTGYDHADGVGADLTARLDACSRQAWPAAGQAVTTTTMEDPAVAVPGMGELEASAVPLPVFTVIVAGIDAFNPCAFFVLLFLLSLLVHARNRVKMATIGVTFVIVSGMLYFVFMAAWLNVFLVTDNIRWITIVAGSIAVTLGALTAKDYFRPGLGPSTSIPEQARPGLFNRMRNLITIDRTAPVMLAAVALAIVANSYELLCTAGLPMVFTRVLTLNDLSTPAYYGYLALYNVVYVVPLLAIVAGFVWTLGSRKLQPSEGRVLKLLSGTMMLGLGGVLLVAPGALENVGAAMAVVGGAVLITIAIAAGERVVRRTSGAAHG